jgi:hypothetical protein
MSAIKRKLVLPLVAILLLPLVVNVVFAVDLIRTDPALPVMVDSPATFSVYIQSGDDASEPHIFLAMTESCYKGLTGDVTVDWPGNPTPKTITNWNMETDNSVKVPSDVDSGTGYTVASLKSHLGTTEPIYWAFEPFLAGPITETPQSFTVVLPSTEPKMLVYALGKSGETTVFNNRVPPTIPGFVVPEPAVVILLITSLSAFAVYAVKRRKSSLRITH